MFYLDYDRLSQFDASDFQSRFKQSVLNMLLNKYWFHPVGIACTPDMISIGPGTLGAFRDRSTFVTLTLSTPAEANRIKTALSEPFNLVIFYLGYSYFPVPVGYVVPSNSLAVDKKQQLTVIILIACIVFALIVTHSVQRYREKRHVKRTMGMAMGPIHISRERYITILFS
jgi:hypothetical protein